MRIYYNRGTNVVTLELEDKTILLGPPTHAIVTLKNEYDFTPSQASEAVLMSIFNGGAEVDLEFVRRVAGSEFFTEATAVG